MGELGQLLRQTREEKGLSLDQVAHETRIRVRFLEALEQEDYEALPTPGHVHGFLRNYTLYLGLDQSEVQALYTAENKPSRFVPGIFRPKDIELAPRRPLVRASVVLGIVLFVVVLVLGGWAFWRYGMPFVQPYVQPYVEPMLQRLTPAAERTAAAASADAATEEAAAVESRATRAATVTQAAETAVALATATPTPTEAAAVATPTETPVPTPTLDRPLLLPTPTPDPTQTPTPTLTPTLTPTPVEGVTLSILVIERAWLQVTIDGQEQPGELLEVDAERSWEAEQSIYFVCGNAGGVVVTVNGENLGALGKRAEVVERTWTPQGEATPTPAPS